MLEEKQITLRQAAKIINVSLEEMMTLTACVNTTIVDYDPSEINAELTL